MSGSSSNDNEVKARVLFDALADVLIARVKSGDASAGELNVARQFLKDNGVDCIPRTGGKLHSLTQALPFTPEGERLTGSD